MVYKKDICGWCMRGVWTGVGEVNTWRKIKSSKLLQLFPHPPFQLPLPSPSPLSPPVFRCHGDDAKLHHRFCPVNILRGGACNPENSSRGAIIFCASHRQITASSFTKYPSSAVQKCARLCTYRPVSVETRSVPRCVFDCSACYLAHLFGFNIGFKVSTTLRGSA